MSSENSAVAVRGLGKSYTIVHTIQHSSLAEALVHRLRHPFKRCEREVIWALRDVDLDLAEGEVLGIVGKNGAGKSTLLKVLSRITEPTVGECVIRGRVGSLLEVGTGFHKELTGRENIYLNGSILGMTRREIARRFDEIVDFSGVETFLDTPVKRYSSGMYVRLAFAVAAHFDPDILIIDEVLAVGDAEFQKKCLGKMNEARSRGRTVLFVSHNMNTVLNLCTRAVLFENGRIAAEGDVRAVVDRYASGAGESDVFRPDRGTRSGDRRATIRDFRVEPDPVHTGDAVRFVFEVERPPTADDRLSMDLGLGLVTESGDKVLEVYSRNTAGRLSAPAGRSAFVATIDCLPLVPGRYHLNLWMGSGAACIDFVENCYTMTVHPGSLGSGTFVENFGFPVSLPMPWRPAGIEQRIAR